MEKYDLLLHLTTWVHFLSADCLNFCPALYFACMSHQTVEYSGYTFRHLPENNPELPKNEVATLASFAARIAFSSRETRSPVK